MQSKLSFGSVACRASTAESHHRAIERTILAMREKYAEPLSLEDLADIAAISPFHFDRVFRQIIGIPPCQFLSTIRIEAAKRLLLTTQFSVTDVCFEVGYNSLGTFISRFTQLVGLPPRRLRLLAESIEEFTPDMLCGGGDAACDESYDGGVSGQIEAPVSFDGLICVGLFPTPIPQCQPRGCALLTSPGPYHITPLPEGRHFLFAAAFPWVDDPMTFLLPDSASMYVGVSKEALMSGGRAESRRDVTLRPVELSDPPILVALPFLLGKRMTLESASAV
jgi:AraC-like DNA-binding protein